MTGHVPQRPGAEIPPAAPVERVIGALALALFVGRVDGVRPHRRRAKEQVPVNMLGHLRRIQRPRRDRGRLWPDGAVGPDVHFTHRSDGARLDDLDGFAQLIRSASLVAHLRGDLELCRRLAHGPGLEHGVGQRLLTVDVLAQLHRRHGGDGVGVIGRADGDGVDRFVHVVEHLAKVVVPFRLLELLEPLGVQPVVVDVTQRDDVAEAAGVLGITQPFAANADAGDVQFFIGRPAVGPHQPPGDPEAKPGQAGLLEELATIALAAHPAAPL